MISKTVSGIVLTVLFVGMLTPAFKIQSVKAEPTTIIVPDNYPTIQKAINAASPGDIIYVRADTYYENAIVNKTIQLIGENRETTIIDGGGLTVVAVTADDVAIQNFTIRNGFSEGESGIRIENGKKIQLQDIKVTNNFYGLSLHNSSGNTISSNTIINNCDGIILSDSSNNILSENNITANERFGVDLSVSSNNTIYRNSIMFNNYEGLTLYESFYNAIFGNNIVNNSKGISLYGWPLGSSNNSIYHNNFINNTIQTYLYKAGINIWDDGYPSGGNYWSDYVGADANGDAIGDTPYIIDENNTDRYPLMNPWTAPPSKFRVGDVIWSTEDLHVRSGPGLHYAVVDTMIKGNIGSILDGPVYSDGYNWWYINYSVGVAGWSAENWLELAPAAPQAPKSFVYWAEAAVSWAKERLGRGDWSGLCMRFVANAFMQKEHEPAGYNAIDGAKEFYRFDQEPNGWLKAPKGALIFFDKEGTNDYGHVGIYLDNGSIIHAYGTVRVNTVEEVIVKPDVGRYLGWSYPPESWRPSQFTFKPVWGSTEYPVTVSSNSIVTDFEFNQPLMQVSFKISGEPGMQGYCNITIPTSLLKGEPWTVQLNGTDWTFTATSNQTHSFLYFTYTHASTFQIVIQGTWAVPEFPSATILTLLMLTTIIATILLKRRREK